MLKKQKKFLEELIKIVPFEGWTKKALTDTSIAIGKDPNYAEIVFPDGVVEAVEYFIEYSDNKMIAELKKAKLTDMRIRDRIITAIKTRLIQHEEYKETIRKTVQFLACPTRALLSMKLLGQTVDHMWHAAGDKSTDFNFYSKRIILAGVYSSTLLYWLTDESEGYKDSWEFLDRRIEEVMMLGRKK